MSCVVCGRKSRSSSWRRPGAAHGFPLQLSDPLRILIRHPRPLPRVDLGLTDPVRNISASQRTSPRPQPLRPDDAPAPAGPGAPTGPRPGSTAQCSPDGSACPGRTTAQPTRCSMNGPPASRSSNCAARSSPSAPCQFAMNVCSTGTLDRPQHRRPVRSQRAATAAPPRRLALATPPRPARGRTTLRPSPRYLSSGDRTCAYVAVVRKRSK
jgi:hypothetical protein